MCVYGSRLPRCPVDNPAFHSAPIRIPSQPSCSQLPRKLHVLTSPVVLAFISCMLYIARSVFSWRCPISPDTGRRVTHGAAPCTLMQCSNDASQSRCTRPVAHRGARCNPVHHHRDAPRCRCTQVVVHRGARCTTVHGGPRDDQIVSQNPSSTGLDFRV